MELHLGHTTKLSFLPFNKDALSDWIVASAVCNTRLFARLIYFPGRLQVRSIGRRRVKSSLTWHLGGRKINRTPTVWGDYEVNEHWNQYDLFSLQLVGCCICGSVGCRNVILSIFVILLCSLVAVFCWGWCFTTGGREIVHSFVHLWRSWLRLVVCQKDPLDWQEVSTSRKTQKWIWCCQQSKAVKKEKQKVSFHESLTRSCFPHNKVSANWNFALRANE